MSKKPDGVKKAGSGYRPGRSHKGYRSREWHQSRRADLAFFARQKRRDEHEARRKTQKTIEANSTVQMSEFQLRAIIAKHEASIRRHLPAPTERERHVARVAAERQKARRAP